MSNEITGNSYKYIIDTSYGINKDGFIACGSESIVYKGLKANIDGSMQFSCVLKFKPKSVKIGGKVVNRLEIFKTEEWRIFDELRECRSIVRIDDVVENLGDFSVSCEYVEDGVINNSMFFCVVEEFIDGWSLEEFCRQEYWKLKRIEALENGLSKVVEYQDFDKEERQSIQQSYNYDNILKYQNQILLFMINFCEIMEFVTEQKNILHLDIKPENIMVTRYGKELVLIDFGKSKKVSKANRFAQSGLPEARYLKKEEVGNMYQYGSLGYAAPECYSMSADGAEFPFAQEFEQGKMSIESDIFSFGATFWECLNIFELVTKSEEFRKDVHDFYWHNFLNDDVYMNRDLSCSSLYYHKKLENILKKCTRKRTEKFLDFENKNYYHSYKELRREIEDVKDSVPVIVKEENVKAKNAFTLSGIMLSLFTVTLIIYFIYHSLAFSMAMNKWDALTTEYNDTKFYSLQETADDMITSAPTGRTDDVYAMIAAFTYEDGDISEYEAEMLVELLRQVDRSDLLQYRIDEIMQHANTKKFKEISTEIVKLENVENSIGYELAVAIFHAEVSKTEILEAYETLLKYEDNLEFRNAVIKLKNVLDNDESIQMIADSEGVNRREIQEYFKTFSQ